MTHILIVDDSPRDIDTIRRILESQGYQTSEAADGEEGIRKAKELQPDLIIMDVVMPGINGFQATRKITKSPETQTIPVMFVSSKNMESDRAWGVMNGAKDYLSKPVTPEALLGAVKKLMS